MVIRDVMKGRVVSIGAQATLEEAVQMIVTERVGLLPALNGEGRLVGVVRLRDIVEMALPSFVGMVEDYDFVHDFGALEISHIPDEKRTQPIESIMQPALAVNAGCGLLRAHAFMLQHAITDLPVIDDEDRLAGIASWVDVGTAFLRHWLGEGE